MGNRIITTILLALLVYGFAMAKEEKPDFVVTNEQGYELLCYIQNDGTVSIAGGKSAKKADKLIIPETIEYNGIQYVVTSIYHSGFWGFSCREIMLPKTLKKIDRDAFEGCSKLEKINMPEGLEEIGNFAFGMTKKLSSIYIPSSVNIFGRDIFYKMKMFSGEYHPIDINLENIPSHVTEDNCLWIGVTKESIRKYYAKYPHKVSNQQESSITQTLQQSAKQEPAKLDQPKNLTSDVDTSLPHTESTNKTTFAIIIANEEYQKESKVDYALNDGKTFKTYCHQVLGLPEKNIHLVSNATLNNIIYELDWLSQVCKVYEGDASVIFYYAGHGIPNEKDGSAYLLPIDGIGKNMRTCLSTEELYKMLGTMPAKSVTVFMDACFSGAKRNGEMLTSARGVAIKAKSESPVGKNMVILSAAQGDETAYSYNEQQHGLFTYYLLKKLKSTGGQVSLGELSDYIKSQVTRFSIVENGKIQTPTVNASPALGDRWKQIKLR